MKHLIFGYGEVGKGLHKVLGESYIYDRNEKYTNYHGHGQPVDWVHVCIPYSKRFNVIVEALKNVSKNIIVHSTVPVGTCDKLKVIHSPIRGVHPNLHIGIKTFWKYLGGQKALGAAQMLSKYGLRCRVYAKARTTEAIKLWDTTQYGRLIMLEKEIFNWCKKNKINFEAVYTQANQDYNEGYMKLGRPEVVRPYLKHVPGPIGGHCVLPNAKLLKIKL